jgi:DNA repair protein RadC
MMTRTSRWDPRHLLRAALRSNGEKPTGREPEPPAQPALDAGEPAGAPLCPAEERQSPPAETGTGEAAFVECFHQLIDGQPCEDPDAWRSQMPASTPYSRANSNQRREPNPDFHGIGHRSRLRERLIEGGADALADYEVLEFLLFGAFQRGDTKPLAKKLIKRFGSLTAVLNADPSALRQVPGVGTATIGVIMIAAVTAKRMARAQVRERPVLNNWGAVIEYVSLDMAHLTRERVRVLYLDHHKRLVRDEHISEGTINEAQVHPREVIHHALDAGATGLILVHNHPSGSLEPSKADVQITNRIAEAGRLMNVEVIDHLIVGSEGHVSMKERGLI